MAAANGEVIGDIPEVGSKVSVCANRYRAKEFGPAREQLETSEFIGYLITRPCQYGDFFQVSTDLEGRSAPRVFKLGICEEPNRTYGAGMKLVSHPTIHISEVTIQEI